MSVKLLGYILCSVVGEIMTNTWTGKGRREKLESIRSLVLQIE